VDPGASFYAKMASGQKKKKVLQHQAVSNVSYDITVQFSKFF